MKLNAIISIAVLVQGASGCSGSESAATPEIPVAATAVSQVNANVQRDTLPDIDLFSPDSGGEFKDFRIYKLSDAIIADFNGDGRKDTAQFRKTEEEACVIISHGGSSEQIVLGCGNELDGIGDDFSWVDEWGILLDRSTFEVKFENDEVAGSEEVLLDNPGIVVTKKESGGGVITFKNRKYIWIHQTC